MSKYIFTKIEDEPFSDPLINKNSNNEFAGPFMGRGKTKNEGASHNEHIFPDMTEEQVDALRYVINRYGITIKDVYNSDFYKHLSPDERKNVLSKLEAYEFTDGSSRIKKYYYSEALFKKFSKVAKDGSSFEEGVFLLLNNDFAYPITTFQYKNNKNQSTKFNLKDIYIAIRGIRDDTSYIINAKNNADLIDIPQKVSKSENTETIVMKAYDILIKPEYFRRLNLLPKITRKFDDFIIRKLAKEYTKLSEIIKEWDQKNLKGLSLTETLNFKMSLKDYIDNYPNSLPEKWKNIIDRVKLPSWFK